MPLDDHTLYLRPEELAVFEKLPKELRGDWRTEEDKELAATADTADRVNVRMSLLKLKDPALKNFFEKMKTVETVGAWESVMDDSDLTKVPEDQWREFLVALGPFGLTMMISTLLEHVQIPEEVDRIAALTIVRKTLSIARSLSLSSHE